MKVHILPLTLYPLPASGARDQGLCGWVCIYCYLNQPSLTSTIIPLSTLSVVKVDNGDTMEAVDFMVGDAHPTLLKVSVYATN